MTKEQLIKQKEYLEKWINHYLKELAEKKDTVSTIKKLKKELKEVEEEIKRADGRVG